MGSRTGLVENWCSKNMTDVRKQEKEDLSCFRTFVFLGSFHITRTFQLLSKWKGSSPSQGPQRSSDVVFT
ncbi:hypothetical protein Krac_3407 [Ktedonobacter racemifer DSM 44963]|uniref:Uncharacterized protein n=1 Tax=Ktedonobacter racemifer DSM 44963 TaxID=485913 RepID=D6U190_KTERA|nr:hypothetical protein Krac_3407 [Ktedonobacter racemifer DSM 44963]